MAFNTGYLLSNIILQIFSCTPIAKYYNPDLPGQCVSLVPPDIAWGAMSMASDFAIAILPLPIIWHLQLSKRDKILTSLVFLTGLIAFAVALTRWIFATVDLTSDDKTWIAGLTFLFSVIEVNTGIICGCSPTLRPLFRFVRDHSVFSRGKSSSFSSTGQTVAEKATLVNPAKHAAKYMARPQKPLDSFDTTTIPSAPNTPDPSPTARPRLPMPEGLGFSVSFPSSPPEGNRLQAEA